jgi:N-acetylglucosamine malate deacetylase 1
MKPRHRTLESVAAILTLGWSGRRPGKMALRRAASRFAAAAFRLRSRHLRLDGFASVLVIAPHPDDETFGCGGALALFARGPTRIRILFVTDGGASHPGHPLMDSRALAAMRLKEARLATAALGIDPVNVSFLDAADGSLAHLEAGPARELGDRISAHLLAQRPDAILLPCRRDGSSEHDAVFELVRGAIGHAGLTPRILEFPVWSWWNPRLLARLAVASGRIWRVDLDAVRQAKSQAMACYASQMHPIPPDTSPALPDGFASMFPGTHEFFFER